MSRSGYRDDFDSSEQWDLIRWRGVVASSMRGKRGQAFLKELVAALDALPTKELGAKVLRGPSGAVCAMGAVGVARGVELEKLDTEDYVQIAHTFGVAAPLVQELEWENDESGRHGETPRERWERIRRWAIANIRGDLPSRPSS